MPQPVSPPAALGICPCPSPALQWGRILSFPPSCYLTEGFFDVFQLSRKTHRPPANRPRQEGGKPPRSWERRYPTGTAAPAFPRTARPLLLPGPADDTSAVEQDRGCPGDPGALPCPLCCQTPLCPLLSAPHGWAGAAAPPPRAPSSSASDCTSRSSPLACPHCLLGPAGRRGASPHFYRSVL